MRKLIYGLLTLVLTSFVLTAGATDLKNIRIGVEGAYPPFSWVDNQGNLKGFDIDIAHALCKAMDAKCTLVQQDWDGMIPALMAHKFDAIVASMSITAEREKKVDFTHKYYQTPARFIGHKGTKIKFLNSGKQDGVITDVSKVDLNKDALKGKTVGVQRATIHDRFLTDVYGNTVTIKRYATQDEVYLDLEAGRIDLALQDSVAGLDGFLDKPQGKDYTFVGPGFADPKWFGTGAGIAVRKGDDPLREALNKAIDKIRADGVYQKLEHKYFTFDIYGS